ncbi:MAG: type III-B CRISPR-associated protein Cas10/Cmr2 [Flammeovirgaceae bacterium]
MRYLFLYTIGPVQSFISQARKTQDLYAGSRLLSDLVSEALRFIENVSRDKNLEVILPHPDNESKPNVLFVELDSSDDTIRQLGEAVRKYIGEYILQAFDQATQSSLELERSGLSLTATGRTQILDSIQQYWVAVPRENTYLEDFQAIYALMGQTKSARYNHPHQLNSKEVLQPKPNATQSDGQKCSVNGIYEVEYYRLSTNDLTRYERVADVSRIDRENFTTSELAQIAQHVWENKLYLPKTKPNQVFSVDVSSRQQVTTSNNLPLLPLRYLQHGEGVSAITMLKRIYKFTRSGSPTHSSDHNHDSSSFPSVAEIAQLAFIREMYNDAPNVMLAFCNACKIGDIIEHQLFYEDNHTREQLRDFAKIGLNRKVFRNAYRNLNQKATELKKGIPKYYAILLFDADRMGKTLTGEWLAEEIKDNQIILNEQVDLKAFQKELSRLLGVYGRAASQFIDLNQKGVTIYAGGDDFLGFLNLQGLLPTILHLRKLFTEMVDIPLKEYIKNQEWGTDESLQYCEMTFSAGVAIAHYKEPLGLVLNAVREAEKKAKNAGGRNAFSILTMKHAGEHIQSYWKWFYEEKSDKDKKMDSPQKCTISIMTEILELLSSKKLSTRFPFKYHASIYDQLNLQGHTAHESKQVVGNSHLMQVALQRSVMRSVELKEDRDEINTVLLKAFELFREHTRLQQESSSVEMTPMPFVNFLNLLYTCSFLYRATNPDLL